MTTVLERINRMSADHYQFSAAFERQQKEAVADVLWKVIHILKVERITSTHDTIEDGDGLLFGMWRVSDVLDSVRSAVVTAVEPTPEVPKP